MKFILKSLFVFIILFLTACSDDEVTPNDRFNSFVEKWNNQELEEMYPFLSTKAKDTYGKENSMERMQKIYNDLNISEVVVELNPLAEEELETAMEAGEAKIPFQVKMESMAGPISFNYAATLVKEGEEEEENWFVHWDPGFIFPEIRDGGEIRIHTTSPERGEILDRNKMPLALNDEIFEVGVIPGELTESSKKEIASLLGLTVESIDSDLSASWVQDDLFVPLKKIDDEGLVQELQALSGTSIRSILGRVYPAGEAASHLVGYLRQVRADDFEDFDESAYAADDMIGARGLERLYEKQLKGEAGVQIVVSNEGEEDVVLAEKPVKDGEDLILTLDINVQEKIYEAYDGDAGTTAAIHPKTGETIALISSPGFDPNEVMYGTDPDIWEKYEENEKQPLINRSIATFAPGSVIKPVTAAVGLANGSIDPKEGIEINGLTWTKGEEWGGYEVTRVSTSNGPVDLKDALVRSDNIYFAMKAIDMGADKFVKGMKQFGFGEDFPYEYPITTSTLSNSGKMDDEVLLANSSYGQGELEMSAIHLATTYTTFLNDGNMIKPTFFLDEETGQIWKESLISADQAKLIQDDLRAVVTDGTAKKADDADFPISGKTGTAELKLTTDETNGAVNSWFVAYPSKDQDILITMMMENTQDKESGYVVELVTELLEEIK